MVISFPFYLYQNDRFKYYYLCLDIELALCPLETNLKNMFCINKKKTGNICSKESIFSGTRYSLLQYDLMIKPEIMVI